MLFFESLEKYDSEISNAIIIAHEISVVSCLQKHLSSVKRSFSAARSNVLIVHEVIRSWKRAGPNFQIRTVEMKNSLE